MKICKLRFENINNLKGEHEISFEKEPIASSGIFAIIGATGSGKSSILDVITLALFNKVPRFSSAITKNEIIEKGAIMTHHTQSAFAEITYETNGNKYTSSWSITHARTGTLKNHEMYLYDQEGQAFDLKKSEVPAQNELLIGLKYEQFVRSIILSQGEFAKFLKANKHERGQLLENITGTEIYRKIGAATYEKLKHTKEQLQLQKDHLGVIEILSDEEHLSMETLIKDRDTQLISYKKEFKKTLELLNQKKEWIEANEHYQLKSTLSKNLLKEWEALHPELKKIELNEQLTPLRVSISNYHQASKNYHLSNEHLIGYTKSLEENKSEFSAVITSMSSLINEPVNKDDFKSKMSLFERKVIDLENEIQNLKTKGSEERERINQDKTNYPLELEDRIDPNRAIQILNEDKQKLEELIKESGLSLEDKLDHEQKKIETKIELKEHLIRYDNHLINRKKEEQKSIQLNESINKINEQLNNQNSIKIELDEKLALLKDQVSLIEKRQLDAARMADLETHRKALEKGTPCPLCGSLEHPFTEHLAEPNIDQLKFKLAEAKNRLIEETERSSKLNQSITTLKTQIDHYKKELINCQNILKELNDEQTKFEIAAQYASQRKNIDIKTLITSLEIEISKLNKAIKSVESLKLNTRLINGYSEMNNVLKRLRASSEKKNELYKGTDVSKDCNELQDRFAKSLKGIEDLEKSILNETERLNGEKRMMQDLEKVLLPKLDQFGITSINTAESHLLSIEQVQIINQKREQSIEKRTINDTELNAVKKKIEVLNQIKLLNELTLEELEDNYQKQEVEIDKIVNELADLNSKIKIDKDNKIKFTDLNKSIELAQKNALKWDFLNKMIGDKNGNTFANFAQGLSLKNLLVYANQRLIKMTDRYLLDLPSEEDSLRVIDQYQGNIRRSVTTLSGGESFLISLALALSLSDMASKNIALDCLFIDEGFGTLDKDSLDVAMQTLEKLQTESQKMVGVISHVEALKERINVKILMNKNAQGYSTISVED